jgi:putative mRNA 3-end processing factor
MHIIHKNGILLKDKDCLYVDASGLRGKNAVITHAHADHAKVSSTNKYFLTKETASLIDAKGKNLFFESVPFKKRFELNGFDCAFYPSGHILGSAQLKICNSDEVVITSDFKLQDSILFKGAEILSSDVLVIETTFGKPDFKFPERSEVYEDMISWMCANLKKDSFIVLGGYSTGKAQELTKFVNEFLGEVPLVHPKIMEQNIVYKSEGVDVGDFIKLDHNLNDSNVLIYPSHLIDDYLVSALEHQLGKRVKVAIATGWNFPSRYKIFPLSDHADFDSLLRYVKESEPKLVLTTHGFEQEFAAHVRRRLGINARSLSSGGQSVINEFMG